jgi:hypothetical protein
MPAAYDLATDMTSPFVQRPLIRRPGYGRGRHELEIDFGSINLTPARNFFRKIATSAGSFGLKRTKTVNRAAFSLGPRPAAGRTIHSFGLLIFTAIGLFEP